MRVWDVAAGYLNRQSLLGEHRELHALYTILSEGKRGYSRHPETLRWVGRLSGLARRHAALVAEMRLRGYRHHSPVDESPQRPEWPETYVTPPGEQFELLQAKYAEKEPGRIPLPRDAQELWAHHKYSVMARDPDVCRTLGRRVARMAPQDPLDTLATELVTILRLSPPSGRLINALQHMWGHVSDSASSKERREVEQDPQTLLRETQRLALETGEPYVGASTALSELAPYVWRAGG